MTKYIYQLADWPDFRWSAETISAPLAAVRHRQGMLLGRMEGLGFAQRDEAELQAHTLDVVKSSEIEGENLDESQVRSSIARRLGLEIAGLVASDRNVDGVVEMSLDAARNYTLPLTEERLFRWHKLLFPGGGKKLAAGAWRNDAAGPMQVVSGAIGRERVHYEAPPAAVLPAEMAAFLEWANRADAADPVLRAAIMHLWFVTLHPFGDGNGRIARVIADWGLARAENTERRFYSVSAQMRAERRAYYDVLERAQKGTLDITAWLLWFLGCLDRALQGAEASLAGVFRAERFWRACDGVELNERQRLMLGRLLEGFSGRLTSTKWAAITRCSQDTAQRDIQALLDKGIMLKAPGGGRNTSYLLREPG